MWLNEWQSIEYLILACEYIFWFIVVFQVRMDRTCSCVDFFALVIMAALRFSDMFTVAHVLLIELTRSTQAFKKLIVAWDVVLRLR